MSRAVRHRVCGDSQVHTVRGWRSGCRQRAMLRRNSSALQKLHRILPHAHRSQLAEQAAAAAVQTSAHIAGRSKPSQASARLDRLRTYAGQVAPALRVVEHARRGQQAVVPHLACRAIEAVAGTHVQTGPLQALPSEAVKL